MPIKGLTDNELAFVQIGTIRKGAPKQPTRPGADLDHFRIVCDEPKVVTELMQAYGPTPKELTILFPFDSVDAIWSAWKESYTAGALVHRCDGEYIQYEIDLKTGRRLIVNGASVETGERVKCDGRAGCKPVGRLRFMLKPLRRLAYFSLVTTSANDIKNISGQLAAILQTAGRLAGIPLILKRKKVAISTPGEGGKRVRREKSLVSIEAEPEWVERKLIALRGQAFYMPALEAPIDESKDDEWEAEELEDDVIDGSFDPTAPSSPVLPAEGGIAESEIFAPPPAEPAPAKPAPQPQPSGKKVIPRNFIRNGPAWAELLKWTASEVLHEEIAPSLGYRLRNVLISAGFAEFTAETLPAAKEAIKAHYAAKAQPQPESEPAQDLETQDEDELPF